MTEQQPQITEPGTDPTEALIPTPLGRITTEPPEPTTPPTPATPPTPLAPEATATAPTAPEPLPAGKDRGVLRAVVRWSAAVLVFAAVAGGTAYGIAGMERTDVPGLETESDGRWEYPTLSRPPLPSGSPRPFAAENAAETHHADLRALVLPPPQGAKDDPALRGEDGWLATKVFLAEFAEQEDREELRQKFLDSGLRHIAARGWTTEDGTHTRVYLLRFGTAAVVDDLIADVAPYSGPGYKVRGTEASVLDGDFAKVPWPGGFSRYAYAESEPYGAQQVRQAYLAAGDVLGVVIQSREGTAKAVPFQQTVTLQSQLLG